jgi:SPP1 gp7 family putative phage head morphogenesis protein
MALSSKEYWKRREEEQLKHNITKEAAFKKEIDRIYADMLDGVQAQVDSFYGKYAGAEGITLAEAKKRVKNLDIEAYERKAAKYVAEKNFSKQANEEMRLYNATMKINRLEMLKANIALETIAGHDELEKYMEDILQGRTMDELKRQAGILGKSITNNAKMANAIVNGSFHSGTFSDRIWQYQDLMRSDLEGILARGLIQGKNPRALASELKKYWYGNDPLTGGGARYCMERLMRTELARVQTEAQKQSFERNGFTMYMFIENGDCCPICKQTAKKDSGHGEGIYFVKDMMPGTNAPPMHPNCRCSVAAHDDDEEYEAWLDYLANGGTTEAWDNLSAEEKQKLTKQNKKAESEKQTAQKTATHTIADGKEIVDTWQRRPDEFAFDIEDVLNAQGFDGLPRVVGAEDFDEAVKQSNFIAQRTYSAPTQDILDAYRDELYNGKWYVDCSTGGAQYGKGMYCAADYDGKLTAGIKAEMSHYQSLGKMRVGFEAYKEKLKTVKASDFNLKYKISDKEFEVVKKYMATSDTMPSIYKLSAEDREIYNSIKPKARDAANSALGKLRTETELNAQYYAYTETLTLDKSAKIFTLKSSDDVTDIKNKLGDVYVKDRVKTSEARALLAKAENLKGNTSADFDEISNAWQNLRNDDTWKNEIAPLYNEWVAKTVRMDEGSVAAMMGYDAINAEGHGQSGSYTVILNRTKVIFKEGG